MPIQLRKAVDPHSLPADVKHKLRLAHLAILAGDIMEANHWLHSISDPGFECLDPFAPMESRECSCGKTHARMEQIPPTADQFVEMLRKTGHKL